MGLDCYVFVEADKVTGEDTPQDKEIWYGRKENEIHGWMQRHSGIEAIEFNCKNLALTQELLDQFEQDMIAGNLIPTSGFFFGKDNTPESVVVAAQDLLTAARFALANGERPYYYSWW